MEKGDPQRQDSSTRRPNFFRSTWRLSGSDFSGFWRTSGFVRRNKETEKVSLQGKGGTTEPWGFIILDPAGRDIGVWYSAVRAAAVEISENGQITKLLPIRTVTQGNQPR